MDDISNLIYKNMCIKIYGRHFWWAEANLRIKNRRHILMNKANDELKQKNISLKYWMNFLIYKSLI